MRKLLVTIFCGVISTGGVFANTLDLAYGSLDTGTSASSVSSVAFFVDYVMPYSGAALVLSTYSTQNYTGGAARTGSWQLSSAGQTSSTISRSLAGSTDAGIASSMHVFSGLSAGANSVSLQHSVDAGEMRTYGGNMVVIPLVTRSGDALNYGLGTMGGASTVSSTGYDASGLSTTVHVDRTTGNGIYIATSFNTKTSTGSSDANTVSSRLEYKKVGDTSWSSVGMENRRYLSGSEDTGSVTLYGAVDDLDSGEYEVRVAAKTETGAGVDVLNGELAAVAMSYTNEMGGGYFEMVGATSAGGENDQNSFEAIEGITADVDSAEGGEFFASMSFGGYVAKGANQTAQFRLSITNESGVVQSTLANERQFVRDYDYGSGGAIGVFTNLSAGSYTVIGEVDELNGATVTENITFVGFSPEAVPEPASVVLIALSGLAGLWFRRRFSV